MFLLFHFILVVLVPLLSIGKWCTFYCSVHRATDNWKALKELEKAVKVYWSAKDRLPPRVNQNFLFKCLKFLKALFCSVLHDM